jgi:hypothetical protein
MAFKYDIEREIAPLAAERTSDGFLLELNLVSFNERRAKYDIRQWDSTHEQMRKGVSLSKEEALALRDALNKEFADE